MTTTTIDQTGTQRSNMITDFIMANLDDNLPANAMDMSRRIMSRWGIHIDWHDFSSALDRLANFSLIRRAGIDSNGMNLYLL